jgi:protein MpaA
MTQPTTYLIGKTVEGREIQRNIFSQPASRNHVLILAGVHGDEVEGTRLLEKFGVFLARQPEFPCNVHLIPCLNLDGYAHASRVNARGVDLNRNLPTQDWGGLGHDRIRQKGVPAAHHARYYPGESACSEPENVALKKLVDERSWSAVISIHSYEKAMVNFNGDHSHALAVIMSNICQLPAKADIGYPTPGSLGTWVGHEMKIPCITLELPRGMTYWDAYEPFVDALWKVCQQCSKS